MPSESLNKIIHRLRRLYPPIKTSLYYKNPFELLIATILSAQCTDARVNVVTKTLFKRFRTPEDFSSADSKELETIVRPTGYYHSKARYVKEASKIIKSFGSRVPDTMEGLLQLPGVGRKTANIILAVAYGKNEGIAVDTHVKRLAKRLGLTLNDNPDKIEKDLMVITPKALWNKLAILLILHGRNVCHARKPRCAGCVLNDVCPSAFSF
ncbi:MAG: endonuclease III [Thaumarchaeota archaeon]|nr:endonuclease III [Nitrososphaerota archaeon]